MLVRGTDIHSTLTINFTEMFCKISKKHTHARAHKIHKSLATQKCKQLLYACSVINTGLDNRVWTRLCLAYARLCMKKKVLLCLRFMLTNRKGVRH